jgi:hypothetical protein
MRGSCAAGALVILFSFSARADDPPPEADRARTEIESTLAGMRGRAQWVRGLLRDARRRGTQKQVVCLDEALSRADVALRRAKEHADASLAAYADANVEVARDERRHVVEHHQAQVVAARDALACSPPRTVATNATTTVKLDVDPRIPRTE